MNSAERSSKAYLLPVLISLGAFSGLNALWNLPQLSLYEIIPQSLAVYLVGGSGLALILLWRATRAGLVSRRELGLDTSGWTPGKRLFGLAITLFMVIPAYVTTPPPPLPETNDSVVDDSAEAAVEGAPTNSTPGDDSDVAVNGSHAEISFSDYAFWFMFLLAPSLAELLVFVSIGFCLPEQWLKLRGVPAIPATIMAAGFAAVMFGLYHFTYEPRWWAYALVPLIPVMMINLFYFTLSRNFWLTLVLHNSFAAVGFMGEQYATYPPDPLMDPQTFLNAAELTPILVAFVVPALGLHWLEAKGWRSPAGEAAPSSL